MAPHLKNLLTAITGVDWQQRVSDLHLSAGVSDCAICGLDGLVWAQSGHGFSESVLNTYPPASGIKIACEGFAYLEERSTLARAETRTRRDEVSAVLAAGVADPACALHVFDGQTDVFEMILSTAEAVSEPDMRQVLPLPGTWFTSPHFGQHSISYLFIGSDTEGQELHFHRGEAGIVFAKCRTCVVVGHYRGGAGRGGACRVSVGKLADWLRTRDM